MLKTQLVAFIVSALFSVVAYAQQTTSVRDNSFSYTYAEAGYQNWDVDIPFGDYEADAIYGDLSYALDEHVFLRGGLAFFDGDFDTDGNRLSAGVGFNTPLKNRLDLVIAGDILRYDSDAEDDIGLGLQAGVRHQTTAELELGGGLKYEDVDFFNDGELGLYGKGLLSLNEQVSVGASLDLFDDFTRFGLFARFNF